MRSFVGVRIVTCAVLFGAGLGWTQASIAESILARFAVNNVNVTLNASAGYIGPGSLPVDTTSDTKHGVASPFGTPVFTLPAGALKIPASTVVKDKAEVNVLFVAEYGTPVLGATRADDWLQFQAAGTVSSVDGHNFVGNPAEAKVNANGRADFFLDADVGGVPRGSVAGDLQLPPLRALAGHESALSITVLENRFPAYPGFAPIATQVAGDAALTLPLIAHSGYRILFNYDASTPFGTDPPFSAQLGMSISGPSDLNGDGAVDAADAGVLFAAWGSNKRPAADQNQDGIVDAADAGLMFAAWTGDSAVAAVPEPCGVGSVILAVTLFTLCRKQIEPCAMVG